jgi:lysyl-tRNA synthetase class 2
MYDVDSSAIDAIGYDLANSALLIRFMSGGTYRYNHVAPGTFVELLNAPSKGSYYHAHIKDAYGYTQ